MAIRIAVLVLLFPVALAVCCQANDGVSNVQNQDKKNPDFNNDVQPLLAEKCGKCHGERVQKGGLDLSSLSAIGTGGESGEALLADSLEESLLWTVLESQEMPPDGEPPLGQSELDLLRHWIESGKAAADASMTPDTEISEHDVLPIVLLRCTTCHGPSLQEGGLDLRTRDGMLRGGKSGPAIVPGDADASSMIQRIESGACPPSDLLLKFFVRRPASAEVDVLRKWIAQGALASNIQPDVASSSTDLLVTEADRQHWAFRSPKQPELGNSIDDFIREQLQQAGLSLSPVADRDTLIRRVYLDLTGMPPSLDEWKRWRISDDPAWYEAMVDHVLASPHYGERWGRYWLDLAGYADSEGGISADPIREVAWKYRDYVIRSFNDDKPYDRFLLEQLAGDELIDHEHASDVTDEIVQNLTATGFLRMGIDETGSRTMNFVPERLKVISDAITVVSSGLMGLTMECARCHSHKYDPIPQRDYYRLKAVFQGALDEHDWKSFKTRRLNVGTKEQRELIAAINPPLEKQIKQLQSRQKDLTKELQLTLLRHHYPDQSDADNRTTLTALGIADNTRTLPQKILVERLQHADLRPDTEQPEAVVETRLTITELERQIQRLRRKLVPPLTIRALWDQGRPSPTYILQRGEHDRPGRLVGPGVPAVLTDGKTPFEIEPPFQDGSPKTGRRLAFARWLTQPDHPLTARVMVNRIWYHHFGTGLVKTLDNFGVQGDPPTHPQLLDWLAIQFVEGGWHLKSMHRLILTSQTYQQSSLVTDELRNVDPQNRLYSRMSLRRLDAEALRDSLLFVSGRLDAIPGGIPDAVSVDRDGLVHVEPNDGGDWRRSIYSQYRRTEIPTIMDTFDYPQMGPNCSARSVSNVSPQSLLLMNDQHVQQLARSFAARVLESLRAQNLVTAEDQVDLVYQLALTRMPDEQERQLGVKTLRELEAAWGGRQQEALETYCHTILNAASFLYVD